MHIVNTAILLNNSTQLQILELTHRCPRCLEYNYVAYDEGN